jgi:signal transduction histidine kinase
MMSQTHSNGTSFFGNLPIQHKIGWVILLTCGTALALLREHRPDLACFLTEDPKGKLLSSYLEALADHLAAEQTEMLSEMEGLAKNVEHIKEIVAMQRNYARLCGDTEIPPPADLVEDAIRMNLGAFERHSITNIREFEDVPPVTVDKHKVLQILVNLLRNAKYGLDELGPPETRLTLRIARDGEHCVFICARENGVGIAPENLTRIIGHGFTTRRDGHGFGLHSGALAAREMGGGLTAHSDGIGEGPSFCLRLPVAVEQSKGEEHETGIHSSDSVVRS